MWLTDILFILSSLAVVAKAQWIELNCPAPRSPINGVSFIFKNGQKVQYRCHPGFFMTGEPEATCRNNKWSHSPPVCITQDINERPISSSNRKLTPSRTMFNWDMARKDPEVMTVTYGNGSNRLPLINGLWGYPYTDSRVLSIVPGLPHSNSIPAEDLVGQEVDIAALRYKLEQEIKNSRHIPHKQTEEKKTQIAYPPLYRNADGFVVGVTNDKYPVYNLGALAEPNDYYSSKRFEPEMAELRRKQIEEARNIQMSAANQRQRARFQNTLTYSHKDIPVWKDRMKSPNIYWSKDTMYKPARVNTNKYYEQSRFHNLMSTMPPYKKQSTTYTIKNNMRYTKYPSFDRNKTSSTNYSTTRMPKFFTNRTISPFTVFVATIPIPPTHISLATQNKTVKSSSNYNAQLLRNKNKTDSMDWPSEAFWFKEPTTSKPIRLSQFTASATPSRNRSTSRTRIITSTPRVFRPNTSHRQRWNKGRNNKRNQHKPQVTHYSHGRVKSTKKNSE